MISRHLIESLALRALLRGRRLADIGTGAGLPGVPLAIAEPGREFSLIESRLKRVRFLRHVTAELGIANATVVHGRAEDLPTGAPFDTVLARAVAPPAELLAIARPLTAPGGVLLLLTAEHLRDAFREAARGFTVLDDVETRAIALKSSIVALERSAA
jgi:16S rRNA (guanine527-N7)-methyltransferase